MEGRSVMEGVLEALPPQVSRTIRVFFSSTFTDMSAERNIIMKEAVPYLRNYCLGKGLDFQVVDMRWGVREETSVDQMTTQLCLKEIHNCQQISRGPNFVVFLGDRYGSCPLPSTVSVKDFQTFHRVAMAMEKDIYLLDKWYLIDRNSDPPVYQIQPITNLLPHYNDQEPANQSLQEKDQKHWQEVEGQLKALFNELTREGYRTGSFDQGHLDHYFMSVTENEIVKGVLEAENTKNSVICFQRTLKNINLQHEKAWRFTDLDGEKVDEDAKDRREKLTKTKIPSSLDASQIFRYSIEWSDENGVNMDNANHASYLRSVCSDFTTSMKRMIDSCLDQGSSLADNDLYTEALHHLHFSVRKSEVFFGREEELVAVQEKMKIVIREGEEEEPLTEEDMKKVQEAAEMVKKVIEEGARKMEAAVKEAEEAEDYEDEEDEEEDEEEDDNNPRNKEHKMMKDSLSKMKVKFHLGDAFDDYESDPSKNPALQQIQLPEMKSYKRPVIIYGESGSGKTALMAKITGLTKSWFENSAMIVRFLGTSPQSSSIREVLVGLCRQIWNIYNIQRVSGIDLNVDYQYLLAYFNALLWNIDTSRKPLVILFDSVDQLYASDHAHTLSWLPIMIPQNVHILVSMMPTIGNCLENTRQHLPYPSQYVEVTPFSVAAGSSMVAAICNNKGRSLNILQKNLLMEQFAKCPQPLFLKLLVDEALTWKSFTPVSDIQVGDTVRSAINKLFDKMERLHGLVLVSKAFGYLCAASQGVSDTEMEDLLSLDDEVLQDTYLYHLPPDPKVIRLPPLLWKRIRDDINEYLTERQSGNKVVVSWYHRQFSEVAKSRYLSELVERDFHASLAEYFLGKWSDLEKPLELFKVKKGSFPNAMRQVPSQPLVYENDQFNVRKLQELPEHLVKSLDFDSFYDVIACSFDWMYGMCKKLSVTNVIVDLKKVMKCRDLMGEIDEAKYNDVKLVHDMLILGSDSIRRNEANLAIQIVSQLGADYPGSPAIQTLVQDALTWLETGPRPHLVPCAQIMPHPGGCLLSTISVDVNILGNDRVFGSCMELCESKRQLYVTEQQPNNKEDRLRIYDLDDNFSCMAVSDFDCKVRSVKFKVDERFLLVEKFDTCSSYNFTSHFELFDGTISAPYDFNCYPKNLCVSSSGDIVAWSEGNTVKVGNLNKKGRTVDVTLTLEEAPCYVLITHDEEYIVTFSEKTSKVYERKTGKVVIDSTPTEKMWSFHDGDKDHSRTTFVTKSNHFIHQGFGYEDKRNIYVTEIPSGETVFKFLGTEHYDFDLCFVEEKEEFMIAGDTSKSYINGNNDKHARIFNLKTGETLKLDCANGPYEDLKLFGEDELWILLAKWKDPVIYLLSAGQRDSPTEVVLMTSLMDHSQSILQYVVSSDLSMMFSASADNTIKLWDLPRLLKDAKEKPKPDSPIANEEEKDEKVKSTKLEDVGQTMKMVFSKDTQDLYISTRTCTVMRRDMGSGQMTVLSSSKSQSGRDIALICLSSSGQHLALSRGNMVSVLDAKTSKEVYTLKHKARQINCLEEGGNVLMAATAGMEAIGRLWSLENGEVLRDVSFLYSFHATAVNHSGTQFIATMFDFPFIMKVHVKENEEEVMVNQPDTMMSACCGAAFSPDDKFAIACSGDGSIRVMEAATNRYLYHMRQRSSITNQTFSPDSKHFLTTGYRSIYVWTMTDGSLVCKLTRHQDFIVCIKFIRDGQFLVTSSRDKTIVIWDFERKMSICSFLAHCEVNVMTVTPDGMTIVYGPENVASLAELTPNQTLKKMLDGKYQREVPKAVEQAQALALGFSSQKVRKQATSQACTIL